MPWNIDKVAQGLRTARERWRSAQSNHAEYPPIGFPSRRELEKIVAGLCGALFPLRLGPNAIRIETEDAFVRDTLALALRRLRGQVALELGYAVPGPQALVDTQAGQLVAAFADSLPQIRELLDSDVEAAYSGDPAARSANEVLISYPGMLAIIHHRLAHRLNQLGATLVARIVAELAHSRTGIDIHPGATIGHSFFIDHGTGVVIGETTVIGDHVRLYQGVTLGARRFPATEQGWLEKGLERHPVVEDEVVIYAGATLLGRITIGRGSVIGGNVWLTESVAPGSHVTQARTKRARQSDIEGDFAI